jgi:DNA-binding transcriptional regulator YiaG
LYDSYPNELQRIGTLTSSERKMNAASQALIAEVVPQSRLTPPAMNAKGASRAAVLTSWKEIARYMGKGVRTVQRWEQDFGLPVRRPYGSNKKAILARPQDLDAWVAMRCQSRASLAIPTDTALGNGTGRLAGKLCALNAEVTTSRMLRASNRALVQEVTSALEQLRASIISIEIKRRAP